jgi:hypothetical protein
LLVVISSSALFGANVPVRHSEGSVHGFLLLSTLDGTPIAEGDVTQVPHGGQVTLRATFHFKDGSLQDETTVFSQRGNFSLVSYHQVQKGPAFPHPTELSVTVPTGHVTVRYTDDKGNEKVEDQHMKLPPDLANGLLPTLLKNLRPGAPLPQFSMVVATPKPQVVKLSLTAEGNEPFSVGGSKGEAMHYTVKVEIGGVAGVVAPIIGKQPPDSHVWVLGGDAPSLLKSDTLSYMGGPLWHAELISPVWPKSRTTESKSESAPKQ